VAPLALEFVLSAKDISQLPPTNAEVAVIGRSNVGKSSLINALANRKKLAQVSNTPGRTRLLNFYGVTKTDGGMVDLPGYGYAAVSGTSRAEWPKMIEGYLLGRESLTMVMVLVDGEIGPTKLDISTLVWVRDHGLPHQVIATKADKVKATGRDKRRRDLASGCNLEPGDVVWVSAAKGTGIDDLRGLIHLWLN